MSDEDDITTEDFKRLSRAVARKRKELLEAVTIAAHELCQFEAELLLSDFMRPPAVYSFLPSKK